MTVKLMRFWPAVAVSIAALTAASAAVGAPPNYCDPLGGCASIKASPSMVKAGKSTVVQGSVGSGRKKPSRVTIYSAAFKGAASHSFAGVPAIYATASKKGTFSTKVTISTTVKRGSYSVSGRCGGGKFGTTTLKVS